MTKWFKKWLVYGTSLILSLILFVPLAFGHASVLGTSPTDGQVLKAAPKQVSLDFSETLQPNLIDLKLYDVNGRTIQPFVAQIRPGKASEMYADVPTLSSGTYTVAWRVVSLDGHPVNGSFTFSVGQPSGGAAHTGTVDRQAQLYQAGLVILRDLVECLLLLCGGLYAMALAGKRYGLPDYADVLGRNRLLLWCVLLLGSIGEWFVYSASLPGNFMAAIFSSGQWTLLQQTPFLTMVGVQVLLLLLLILPGMMPAWSCLMWGLLVCNLALGGHAYGIEPLWLAIATRMLHLLAISAWLGSLSYLFLTMIWQQRQEQTLDRSKFRSFFVKTVLIASLTVAGTGIVMVSIQSDWLKVIRLQDLWSNVLLIKIVLLIVMLVLAFVQTMRWRRQDSALHQGLLSAEWLIGLIVICAGVLLSQIAYPPPIKSYDQNVQSPQATTAVAHVQIDKLELGDHLMTFHLPQVNSQDPNEVHTFMEMGSMGSLEVPVQKTGPSQYTSKVQFFMIGKWQFDIDAQYPDGEDLAWSDSFFIPGGQ